MRSQTLRLFFWEEVLSKNIPLAKKNLGNSPQSGLLKSVSTKRSKPRECKQNAFYFTFSFNKSSDKKMKEDFFIWSIFTVERDFHENIWESICLEAKFKQIIFATTEWLQSGLRKGPILPNFLGFSNSIVEIFANSSDRFVRLDPS